MRDAASELGTRRPLYTQYRGDHYTEPATHFEQLSTVTHTYQPVPDQKKTFEQEKSDSDGLTVESIHISVESFLFEQQTNLSSSPSQFSFAIPSITNSNTSFSFCLLFQSSISVIQSGYASACFFLLPGKFQIMQTNSCEKLELYLSDASDES